MRHLAPVTSLCNAYDGWAWDYNKEAQSVVKSLDGEVVLPQKGTKGIIILVRW